MGEVTPQIHRHLTANMDIKKKDIMVGNFLGGLFWGVGSVIGAGVAVAIIGYALSLLGVFRAVAGFIQQAPQIQQLYR